MPDASGRPPGDDVEHYHFLGDNLDGEDGRQHAAADAMNVFHAQLSPD